MHVTFLPEPGQRAAVPGAALIRTLAGAALTTSALAAAALAVALGAPGSARAGTVAPAQPFGPTLATSAGSGEGLVAATATPALPRSPRAAAPQLRLESGDGAVATVYRIHDYDLRLEYGTVFYPAAALPGQPPSLVTQSGRLMSRLVTRF